MEVITQTNRTMLFEEINPEKLNLLTLVGDSKDLESLDDDKIKEIHEKLLVRNFDEFLEKFEPVVYSFFNANTQSVLYTLEKPENIPEEYISEIPLNRQNDFLNMLFTLIDTKKAQGLMNVDYIQGDTASIRIVYNFLGTVKSGSTVTPEEIISVMERVSYLNRVESFIHSNKKASQQYNHIHNPSKQMRNTNSVEKQTPQSDIDELLRILASL